jgi:tol-pal system protein YbgF
MNRLAPSLLTLALASALTLSPLAATAQSGRLSLSERIAKLESQNQGQGGQSMVDLLNRISELQSEVQSLRGLVENQAFEIEELKKRARDQYVDLDSRISRIESGGARPLGSAGVSSTAIEPGQTQPLSAAPAQPGQLMMEPTTAPPPANTTGQALGTASTDQFAAPPVDALPATAAAPANPASALPSQPGDEQAGYDAAFAALREGRYAESARRFSSFLQQFPNGDLADNATYWLGESYYVTQNYRIALDTFRSLLDRFPQSAKAADALLKLGYCHYELREWADAEAALNQVVQRYPDTTVARLAQGRLRALRLEGRTP